MRPFVGDYLRTELVEDGRVVVIRFAWEDNPLNSLCDALADEMEQILDHAAGSRKVRAVVLTADGPVFSTGAHLPELMQQDAQGALHLSRKGIRIWGMFETIPKPTCAAINGLCLGGGLEIALCCDFRIASKRARLGQTEINLGLIPGWGGTQRLTRLVGRPIALEMVLSGQQVRADKALEMGLVNRVVDHRLLMAETLAFLRPMIEKSPPAIALAKTALQFPLELGHRAGLEAEATYFSQAWSLPSTRRIVREFMDRQARKGAEGKKGV